MFNTICKRGLWLLLFSCLLAAGCGSSIGTDNSNAAVFFDGVDDQGQEEEQGEDDFHGD